MWTEGNQASFWEKQGAQEKGGGYFGCHHGEHAPHHQASGQQPGAVRFVGQESHGHQRQSIQHLYAGSCQVFAALLRGSPMFCMIWPHKLPCVGGLRGGLKELQTGPTAAHVAPSSPVLLFFESVKGALKLETGRWCILLGDLRSKVSPAPNWSV